jgi:hypothetical protein
MVKGLSKGVFCNNKLAFFLKSLFVQKFFARVGHIAQQISLNSINSKLTWRKSTFIS